MDWLEIMGIVANILGIAGAMFAAGAWLKTRWIQREMQAEKARQNKKVKIVLQHGGQSHELPVELRRTELTRSEILGRLGMVPMKVRSKRFSIAYLNTDKFLRRINEIMAGTTDAILEISCTREEFEQFDL